MLIYNHSVVDRLLSCLLKDSTLCLNSKYPFDPKANDFCTQMHKYVWGSIVNLAKRGYKVISIMDLEEYMKSYATVWSIYNDNGGRAYINTIMKLGDSKNFDGYYEQVRLYSAIRDYQSLGYDISKFWDINKKDEDNIAGLDDVKVEDVINHFEGLQVGQRRKYSRTTVKEEYVAGTNFEETMESFKTSPLIGNSFQSETLNGIFRGMFGFILRVAKSGGGKSILSMADLCKCTVTEYWDYNKQAFVKNKSREGASLFINTELEIREELDPIIIAYISGVERSHIIDGRYDEGEEDRVSYAGKILLESELYVVDDPEFTCESLVETIKDYAFNKHIKTCCYDYVSNNGFVANSISRETKIPQREDMVLLALIDRLKQVQRETGISLISSVQSNGAEDNMDYPTEACMAGGKSQVRKTNGTLAMFPPKPKEIESTRPMWTKDRFGVPIEPNNVCHIIKGRGSKYPKYIKVFQKIELGTGRTIDLFCTDKNNNPIKVDKMIIEKE